MQDLPEKSMLLDALAQFLDQQVRPKLADPGLAFRVRIAVSLAQLVAREIRAEDQHDAREITRLSRLLHDTTGDGHAVRKEREDQIRALQKKVIEKLKGASDAEFREIHAALKESLVDKLAVAQPRFDTSLSIE
jgi:hypothetical protein